MRLIKRPDLVQHEDGEFVIHTEDNEDMWHLYNLIDIGDLITSKTSRKVVNQSSTGSTTSTKVITRLTIQIDNIEWDADTCSLRMKGVNKVENDYVRLGQSHTLELTTNMTLGIKKPQWDQQHVERINMACNPMTSMQVAAVVMHTGLAHICFITKYMTIVKAKIEISVPKKRSGPSGHDKAVTRFYQHVAEAIHKNVPMADVKCLLIASPAFIGEDFLKFCMERAKKEGWSDLLENKSKIRTVHAASGHKHALMETLKDPSVRSLVSETSAMRETELMETFMTLMSTDPDRAYYGLDDVRRANDAGAIQTLMVSDALFKSSDIHTRSIYVNFVDEVKSAGAEVVVFSHANVSGEQLTQITGIAAILTYGLPEVDEEEEAELYQQTLTVVKSHEGEEGAEAAVQSLSIDGKKSKKDKKDKKSKGDKKEGKKSKKSSSDSDANGDDIMYI